MGCSGLFRGWLHPPGSTRIVRAGADPGSAGAAMECGVAVRVGRPYDGTGLVVAHS